MINLMSHFILLDSFGEGVGLFIHLQVMYIKDQLCHRNPHYDGNDFWEFWRDARQDCGGPAIYLHVMKA